MKIAGYASTSGMDAVRHVVAPDAYRRSIAERGFTGGKGIKLLHQHQNVVIGRIENLEIRPDGLWIDAKLWTDDIPEAASVAGQIKAADGLNFSVGMFVDTASVIDGPDGEPMLFIEAVDLVEISIVVQPANEQCQIVEYTGKTSTRAFDQIAANLAAIRATLATVS